MRSSWRVAHFSSAPALLIAASLLAGGADARTASPSGAADTAQSGSGSAGPFIGAVRYEGLERLERRSVTSGTLLRSGALLTDRLLSRELARVDSLLTAAGLLGAEVQIDSLMREGTADLRIAIAEGEPALVGSATVTGSDVYEAEQVLDRLGLHRGARFDPRGLNRSMAALLADLNARGYPFAQIWITGFTWRREAGEVDLSVAAYGGEAATIGAVIFEGLDGTDTTLALRITRLRPGRPYDERSVGRAVRFLVSSGHFSGVGEPQIGRLRPGSVDVRIPVTERERRNRFEGMFGFSRKADGGYRTSGSVDLGLENIGGTGRSAAFRWLGDGEQYRTTWIRYGEPFLFTLPVSLDTELRQDVYDTLYDFSLAGFDLSAAAGPRLSFSAGFTWDGTVPRDDPALDRSVRNRLSTGVAFRGSAAAASLKLEGARKKNYRPGASDDTWSQLLYRFDADLTVPTIASQAFFARVAAEGVVSANAISLSETYPLGGARTLRGYRENQFRGERIVYVNIEYRFGGDSRLFLFDDVGSYYRPEEGWTLKNGFGFGLRSSSKLGTVEMSFGAGERLALEETRIHISLIESF